MAVNDTAGALLRQWRARRNLTQLDLANRAGISTRHLSYVETGRSRPTPGMILRLCDHLAVPLREQNQVLLAGGFAPTHPEHGLQDLPMAQAARAIEAILEAHLPHPALVVDRHWDLVAANDALYRLLDGVDVALLEPPVNVVRLTLDPQGLAPRIVNLSEWRRHLIARLRRECDISADLELRGLLEEYDEAFRNLNPINTSAALIVPLRMLAVDGTELSFISTTTVFGTPREVTLSELAIEAFYPGDEVTRRYLSSISTSRLT